MVLIDFFKILKVIVILRFYYFFMDYIPTQNGTVLEETLAGSSSDTVETVLRRLHNFKMTLSLLQAPQKSLPIHLSHFDKQ